MVVQGQPKTAAEYIQATSRVGRQALKHGLVVTLLNIHKPRDRTHYEQFRGFHMSFYRAVEATSVTPFAPRALDRALAATLVAALRHVDPDLTPNKAADRIAGAASAFQRVRVVVEAKMRFAGYDSVSIQGCLARLDELRTAWIEIVDKQTKNGGDFAYANEEPVRRLLSASLAPAPKGIFRMSSGGTSRIVTETVPAASRCFGSNVKSALTRRTFRFAAPAAPLGHAGRSLQAEVLGPVRGPQSVADAAPHGWGGLRRRPEAAASFGDQHLLPSDRHGDLADESGRPRTPDDIGAQDDDRRDTLFAELFGGPARNFATEGGFQGFLGRRDRARAS